MNCTSVPYETQQDDLTVFGFGGCGLVNINALHPTVCDASKEDWRGVLCLVMG